MRQVLVIPILILAGLAIFSFSVRPSSAPEPSSFIFGATPALRSAQAFLLPAANPGYAPVRDTNVSEPVLDANAALLTHLESGRVLYEKNAGMQVPIASLTKMLSALVATNLFDMQEIVAVASGSVRVDGQKQTLYLDERLTVNDLVSMMLVESSNDAAYALAAYAKDRNVDFVAEMNKTAFALGMESCRFLDPAGLDDTATCDANDLLRLVRALLRQAPQLFPMTTHPQLVIRSADGGIAHEVKSTNELLGKLDGIIGGKTGYTDGALGCLVLVVKLAGKDDTLISIVLGSRSRFTDTETLVSWATRGYQWQ